MSIHPCVLKCDLELWSLFHSFAKEQQLCSVPKNCDKDRPSFLDNCWNRFLTTKLGDIDLICLVVLLHSKWSFTCLTSSHTDDEWLQCNYYDQGQRFLCSFNSSSLLHNDLHTPLWNILSLSMNIPKMAMNLSGG